MSLRKNGEKLLQLLKEWSVVSAMIGALAFAGVVWSAAASGPEVLSELAQMAPEEFAQNLPALRKAAEHTLANAALSPATLLELSGKLKATDSSAPDYWPTVLQFIQFASRGVNPTVQAGLRRIAIGNNGGFPRFGTIADGEVTLDGGELGRTRFEKSKIIFTEHEVKMRDVSFEDCVFEFPSTELPNPYLRSLGHAILEAGIKNVVISGP
jgi:hypothetical protein